MKIFTILFSLSTFVFANDKSELILDIEKSLMASCFHGTVYEHGNAEMEKEIAAFVAQGKDKSFIINHYVNKYGQRILAMPKAKGFNIFAWLAPLAICALGGGIIFAYFRIPQTQNDNDSVKIRDKNLKFDDEIETELKELDQ
ncbi:MAG: hypothetical protein CMF85_06030 [Candidatus Marinimicrobia bacterium]|nr:hypothetical protein [Candidatus Neomarinimicrobiota bacterium]|tara:strand:- start:4546 stop:4974 length:429 start_codon:yes stop_codon:yes gene_type:complete